MKKIYLTFMLLSVFIAPQKTFSHPHLFIKPTITLDVQGDVLKGVSVKWNWDEWWSMDVINSADVDRNGVFDSGEVQSIYDNFFIGVREFGFFTDVFVDGRRIIFNDVTNFNAVIEQDKTVSYTFYIPVDTKVTSKSKIKVEMNDPTIFVAFDKLNVAGSKATGVINSRSGFYGVAAEFGVRP